jgi:lactate dehydrogenase-like 2-hydroxyacid dehydrogenase
MAVSFAALLFDITPILAVAVNRASVTGRVPTHQVLRRATLARHVGSATTAAQRRVVDTCARAVRAVVGGCMPDTVVHREVYE